MAYANLTYFGQSPDPGVKSTGKPAPPIPSREHAEQAVVFTHRHRIAVEMHVRTLRGMIDDLRQQHDEATSRLISAAAAEYQAHDELKASVVGVRDERPMTADYASWPAQSQASNRRA